MHPCSMQPTPETIARVKEVIDAWSNPAEVAAFALKRRGFGDSNGGFGVVYPHGLDEYQREVEGMFIPDGHVELYGFWGPAHGGYEFLVAEKLYLAILADYLQSLGRVDEADSLRLQAEGIG